jgi:hypothetical protein
LSFVGCFRILQCRLPECLGTTAQTFDAWYENLLWEMRQEVIEARRNRANPRVIKRKMSKWPKKRNEHRNLPPLKKTFGNFSITPKREGRTAAQPSGVLGGS